MDFTTIHSIIHPAGALGLRLPKENIVPFVPSPQAQRIVEAHDGLALVVEHVLDSSNPETHSGKFPGKKQNGEGTIENHHTFRLTKPNGFVGPRVGMPSSVCN